MSDLVERLRALVIIDEVRSENRLGQEAADLIESQAARIRLAGKVIVILNDRIKALEAGLRDMRATYVQFDNDYALDRIVDMIDDLLGGSNG